MNVNRKLLWNLSFLGKQYGAHNALGDLRALKELFQAKLLPLCISTNVFIEHNGCRIFNALVQLCVHYFSD